MNQFPENIDTHNYVQRLIRAKQRLLESAMLPENRQLIIEFIEHCEAQKNETGYAITIKYAQCLRKIGSLIVKPFKEMDEKDIDSLLVKLQNQKTEKGLPYKPSYMTDFRKTISKFWRWLYFDEYQGDAPKAIKRMKLKEKIARGEPEIFTKEEIKKLIEGMTTIRNKAFFYCLYDLQCRVSELLSRQIKHIGYTPAGEIQIKIEADKTSKIHSETLYESSSFFATWLKLHPLPDEPNAPLWMLMRQKGKIVNLSYGNVRKIFLNALKRQGIRKGKQSNIHMLRKSKATHDMADGVPITIIKSRGSWVKGSQALQQCYLSVQEKDKDNAYRKKYGMAVNNGHEEASPLSSCARCHATLEAKDNLCGTCGFPTSKAFAAKMQEIDKSTADMVDVNMLSEMIKKIVMESLKEMKTNGTTQ